MEMSKIFNIEKNGFDINVTFDLCNKLYIVNVSKNKLRFRDEFSNYENALNYTLKIIDKIHKINTLNNIKTSL